MSFTTADLIPLETALKTGKTEVRIGDMLVKFPSVDDLIRRIQYIRGDLEANGLLAAPATAAARTALIAHSRD
jgi:hypothetical protein